MLTFVIYVLKIICQLKICNIILWGFEGQGLRICISFPYSIIRFLKKIYSICNLVSNFIMTMVQSGQGSYNFPRSKFSHFVLLNNYASLIHFDLGKGEILTGQQHCRHQFTVQIGSLRQSHALQAKPAHRSNLIKGFKLNRGLNFKPFYFHFYEQLLCLRDI